MNASPDPQEDLNPERVYNSQLGVSRPKGARRAPVGPTSVVEGTVVEALPSALYTIRLATGHRILAHVAPRARVHFIRLVPGDRVRVELSPYDTGRGRIVEHVKG